MPHSSHKELGETIRTKAESLGFHACGIVPARHLAEDENILKKWLQRQWHGTMEYMENHSEKRTDPSLLLPGAKSVIVLLYNYYPEKNLSGDQGFRVSKYAYGTDYHFVIKRKLKELATLVTTGMQGAAARAFVDSAPVLERAWAREAGLGWIGKNTCLITREQGSYFFIGVIITDAELEYDDTKVPNHCGGCTRCIDACPTKALSSEGLDARKCISYLTIEYRGEKIPGEFRGKMEGWIFGCDICQDVCPWNRLSDPHREQEFIPSAELQAMTFNDWNKLDEKDFQRLFRNSPLKRTKFSGIRRNIEFVSSKSEDDIAEMGGITPSVQ